MGPFTGKYISLVLMFLEVHSRTSHIISFSFLREPLDFPCSLSCTGFNSGTRPYHFFIFILYSRSRDGLLSPSKTSQNFGKTPEAEIDTFSTHQ